ncbi:MFS transporter [Actinomadura sp. 7K507]|uniref:MFS transporter n=1 Tax=Actinomadura sp. 7K507 TaxID=2530365 RepID=UPI00140528EB|nr:MFS transporter [Actinomadura sp. 7K507]
MLINTIGNGVSLGVIPVYLIRSVGLPPTQVGVGLTIAGIVGLLASIPLGHLADAYGPRNVLMIALAVQAMASIGLIFIANIITFTLVVCLNALAMTAVHAVGGALVGVLAEGADRTRNRAYIRAATNAGLVFGTLLGGFVIQADTRTVYMAALVFDAVTFLSASVLLRGIPNVRSGTDSSRSSRFTALKDRRYLVVTALNAVIFLQASIPTLILPLWIVESIDAPRILITVTLVINTGMVILFQVMAAKYAASTRAAAASIRWAGLFFLAGCVLIGVSAGLPVPLVITVIVVGVIVHTVGELLHAVGSFELSYRLATEGLHGQYQGVFTMGIGVGQAAAPMVLTALCIGLGTTGWLIAGAGLALAAVVMPIAVRHEPQEVRSF